MVASDLGTRNLNVVPSPNTAGSEKQGQIVENERNNLISTFGDTSPYGPTEPAETQSPMANPGMPIGGVDEIFNPVDNTVCDTQSSPSHDVPDLSLDEPPISANNQFLSFLSDMNTIYGNHLSPHLADLLSLGSEMTASTQGPSNWSLHEYDASNDPLPLSFLGDLAEHDRAEQITGSPPTCDQSIDAWSQLLETLPPGPNIQGNQQTASALHHLNIDGAGIDALEALFERQICRILSIADEPTENPWRTLIWPLVKESPALYHAIAAMTYLCMSKTQPQLRNQGIAHVQNSMEALAIGMGSSDMPMHANIAAMLALGFAETWDYEKSSTGLGHINGAKMLIEKALSTHLTSSYSDVELKRLTFLANTCIYMDVMARVTSLRNNNSSNFDIMAACKSLNLEHSTYLDPLMGYAASLFPTIGRVADLVGRVRTRTAKRNSPAIISAAIELKKTVENWVPPVDLESVDDVTYNISDSIQTAEAYRWATLLLLRQAVPELPSVYSWSDLAQKALLFLATIPLMSRTTIIQIFPLMVAGSEALEEEDREWVRERWTLMSKHMITGIVDRCLEVTDEVWRRRNEYATRWNFCQLCGAPPSPSNAYMRDDSETLSNLQFDMAPTNTDERRARSSCSCAAPTQSHSGSSDFPESVAFKKGADLWTRTGCIDYTVRGKLHWLSVMKDWNWEGEYRL